MSDPSSHPPTVNLRDLFLALQEELAAALRADRVAFAHPSARGETTELDWVTMIAKHLPVRYQASRAFVVDADGLSSEQIDMVIYDRQYCPLLFTRHGHHYIPAESVYAVFEIKQTFNREHLVAAGTKAASVRRLRRTSAPIPYAEGTYGPRPLFEIVAGILALDSSWRPPLGESLSAVLRDLPPRGRLQLGCALQQGTFEATYDAEGVLDLRTSERETALVHFFLSLLRLLQSLATVPAIDLTQYAKALGWPGADPV
jgi:hypothetical protein